MYCPACFNKTLALKTSGVIRLELNGRHLSNGLFTYNVTKETLAEILANLERKTEEFIKWYASLNHHLPIETFHVFSSDFTCQKRCAQNPSNKMTIIGVLFQPEEVQTILVKVCQKYNIEIDSKLELNTPSTI